MIESNINSLKNWFLERPKWLQYAAKHLIKNSEIDENTIKEITDLCLQEVKSEFSNIDHTIPQNAFTTSDDEEIRLCSISEITGVNKLNPRKPLDFGNSNIAIVYGHNGSGKSSYVRLLKHICGARDIVLGKLHGNTYSENDTEQKATISFLKNDSIINYEWKGIDACAPLHSVGIFDTSFGQVFMGNENEVSYEPPVLSFFTSLIDICGQVDANLKQKADALQSKMPTMPSHLSETSTGEWLKKLAHNTPTDEINFYCCLSNPEITELDELQKRLNVESPSEQANKLRNQKKYIDEMINDFQSYIDKLSDENCRRITELKQRVSKTKAAAETAANSIKNDVYLDGIGSDVWQELWNAARKYSKEQAYVGHDFPNTQDNSVCVLCHQTLSEDAKKRLHAFDSYIKGETQRKYQIAVKEVNETIKALPDIPDTSTLKTKIDAAGITDQDITLTLASIVTNLSDRKSKILSPICELESITTSNFFECFHRLSEISQDYANKIKTYEEDARKDNRHKLNARLKNLLAKKWLAEQKASILEEFDRLKLLKVIYQARKIASTTALSRKKGELAEEFITDAFVQRFNTELKELGISRIKVEIIKSKVSKGRVLHRLRLDKAKHNINEILSEGEQRIVSIAAFLADVRGGASSAPFIFDDPISSLDQDYEEAFIRRLCAIASNRQIIIFTHRISLLGMVNDYAEKAGNSSEVIYIREESWGAGESGSTPLFALKPKKALNELIEKRLTMAKQKLEEGGNDAYSIHAKALCSEFRNILERMVELELTNGIVERHRRSIHTMGKLIKLAKISDEDCKLFDDLMTKYSRYEHSQSREAPVQLPQPDELEDDFNELRNWHEEFKKRPANSIQN